MSEQETESASIAENQLSDISSAAATHSIVDLRHSPEQVKRARVRLHATISITIFPVALVALWSGAYKLWQAISRVQDRYHRPDISTGTAILVIAAVIAATGFFLGLKSITNKPESCLTAIAGTILNAVIAVIATTVLIGALAIQ